MKNTEQRIAPYPRFGAAPLARKGRRIEMTYLCDDGNAEIEIEADSPETAAREYVDGGCWGDVDKTIWIRVYVQEVDEAGANVGERESITITLDPDPPSCTAEQGDAHDWRAPYECLGGLRENPGVWGSGGGVIIKTVCAHCGAYRVVDTWAQNPDNGEQGLRSTEYRDADDASRVYCRWREVDRWETQELDP